MIRMTKLVAATLLLGAALPALAQVPPPPGAPITMRPLGGPHGRMFGAMSDAGRATMMSAMRSADARADKDAMRAARDRMLDVLEAPRLDVAALRAAMEDEREASNAVRVRHQAAMLQGFQQLSLDDRKAFVADARAMRERMDERMAERRQRRAERRGGAVPPQ